jgi:Flp pilus assembly protein protease CpaA
MSSTVASWLASVGVAGLAGATSLLLVPLATAAAAAALIIAVATDVARREIPDGAALSVALAAGLALLALPGGQMISSLVMTATLGGLAVLGWRHGLLGGGDVKMMAALGAWLTPATLGLFLLGLSLAILATVPLFLLARRVAALRGRPLPAALADPGFPFALALAGGGFPALAARAGLLPQSALLAGPWT